MVGSPAIPSGAVASGPGVPDPGVSDPGMPDPGVLVSIVSVEEEGEEVLQSVFFQSNDRCFQTKTIGLLALNSLLTSEIAF